MQLVLNSLEYQVRALICLGHSNELSKATNKGQLVVFDIFLEYASTKL